MNLGKKLKKKNRKTTTRCPKINNTKKKKKIGSGKNQESINEIKIVWQIEGRHIMTSIPIIIIHEKEKKTMKENQY